MTHVNIRVEAGVAAVVLSRGKSPPAFRSNKRLLRGPVAEGMRRREGASIKDFVDIWYSEETWRNLQEIRIR